MCFYINTGYLFFGARGLETPLNTGLFLTKLFSGSFLNIKYYSEDIGYENRHCNSCI